MYIYICMYVYIYTDIYIYDIMIYIYICNISYDIIQWVTLHTNTTCPSRDALSAPKVQIPGTALTRPPEFQRPTRRCPEDHRTTLGIFTHFSGELSELWQWMRLPE